jgi:hypothetical protein
MANRKGTNNDLQNITHTTKDRVTRTPLKTGAVLRCSVIKKKTHARSVPKVSTHNITTIKSRLAINIATL